MSKKEKEFPKEGRSMGGTEFGFSVEVRHNYHEPKDIFGVTYTKEWKRIDIKTDKMGVPTHNINYQYFLTPLGLVNYAAAKTLQYWFHAELEAHGLLNNMCFESRIIKHKVTHSVSEIREESFDLLTQRKMK